jgi:hypothetical protein
MSDRRAAEKLFPPMPLLSQAIRFGAMLRPQTFGSFLDERGSCAMGAALEAVGRTQFNIPKEWHWTFDRSWTSPVGLRRDLVWHMIQYLNDELRWSRERIADWVEAREKEFLEPAAATEETTSISARSEAEEEMLV